MNAKMKEKIAVMLLDVFYGLRDEDGLRIWHGEWVRGLSERDNDAYHLRVRSALRRLETYYDKTKDNQNV
jgi:hypothetical protein